MTASTDPLVAGPDTQVERAPGLLALGSYLRHGKASSDARRLFLTGGREADTFYRHRWSHDKMVHSTHGVNCTGSCAWEVYVTDGIITWEKQITDYPTTGPDMPEYEPRGCPRGAAFSWYTYSPTRIRYPYVRSALLDAFRAARARHDGDAVAAWAQVTGDAATARAYKSARGRGGMVRVGWDEAMEIIAAAYVHTIRTWGPDRCAGFSVIPAMSMLSYGAGGRFHELIGATMLSFYDWYADLPPASPQVFGDQTDVPEAGDWYNSQYLIMWGSNVPLTRTPDAHFMTEARYHGQKVIVVSPDYADNTKFADQWLRVAPGTDGAMAMAMGHVILKEFHVEGHEPYFLEYMRRHTDAPFLLELDTTSDGTGYVPGRFVTADSVPGVAEGAPKNEFRPLVWDRQRGPADPGGTLADRFTPEGEGKWNLLMEGVRPIMSIAELDATGVSVRGVEVLLPRFDLPGSTTTAGSVGGGVLHRGVPATRLADGRLVTTVYDLLLANYGVERKGLPGRWPEDYHDATAPGTPAWASELTGVPGPAMIRVAREFAVNAVETRGRSQILMGAGINHYYHADEIYRAILALTSMCGTQGVGGGGWAHYVGQEKVRTIAGWSQFAFALDWQRPARQMISTGFWYLTTDQWRYDDTPAERLASPLGAGTLAGKTTADTMVEAMRRGWTPSYPTFNRNPLLLGRQAEEAGMKPAAYVVDQLTRGELRFAAEDPDAPENFPRILASWRTNLLGSSAKGTEYFLRHMVGAGGDVNATETPEGRRPASMTWREPAPEGKLDLIWTADFRNTSTTLHSDVVLPAATWYEKYDLATTDMHPFIHSFNAAIDPPWQARSDFDIYRRLAGMVSAWAPTYLGTQTDIIPVPLSHDTPDAMTMAHGDVSALPQQWMPGVTMPKLVAVERDYTQILNKFDTVGPLVEKPGIPAKGIMLIADEEMDELRRAHGTGRGAGAGRPLIDTPIKAGDAVMHMSGATNGRLATQGWRTLSKRTGTPLVELSEEEAGRQITFADTQIKPQPVITTPEWSGSEHGGRRYSAFVVNVEHAKPWHTLTGRMHYYLDHDWMRDMGESLPTFRPPLDFACLYGEAAPGSVSASQAGTAQVAVRYLTIHNKWAIHSQYYDNLYMLTLGRGGQTIWMSPADADKIGVRDNEWVEAYNRNGIVAARAVVSHRIPEGTVFMHHAQERTMNTPVTESSGRRGGTHNSLTRIVLKPSHFAGGYAQLSYAFNYIGPTGNNRDEVTLIRRRTDQEVTF
ncbi:nitrate reductase subunit alpha [Actinomyces sp. oral taxon 448]|uniref:nitrate reductase subunit alpha n=1 Tax=Actinomyces sp. oral taxon 448 TaxID=712124 RepID=UPI000218A30E|nr:nitrate reductase subunit alpha [Actinomyces sp. oral taxon 448]EGQ72984.1 respiratory nitrate reductase, alpha subunit [Actinomyces sp. oral taxon 448 str. F0400]